MYVVGLSVDVSQLNTACDPRIKLAFSCITFIDIVVLKDTFNMCIETNCVFSI